MADVQADFEDWSVTASNNSPGNATVIGSGLDDNLQQIQATVRQYLGHKGGDIASGATVDLSTATGLAVDVTGTTSITSFGTCSSGRWFILQFDGILTLTHNATSLKLPGNANITTAAGDIAIVISEGSGNWRCVSYLDRSSVPYDQAAVDINGGTIDGAVIGGASAAAITGTTVTTNTGLVPDTDDGAYLGQSGTAFSDLFLASGGVINWNAGDVTLTHSANTLTLGGTTTFDAGAAAITTTGNITLDSAGSGVLTITGGNTGSDQFVVSRDIGSLGTVGINMASGDPTIYFDDDVDQIYAIGVDANTDTFWITEGNKQASSGTTRLTHGATTWNFQDNEIKTTGNITSVSTTITNEARLHLREDSSSAGNEMILLQNRDASAVDARIAFITSGTSLSDDRFTWIGTEQVSTNGNDFVIATNASGGSAIEAMRISSAQDVGIGTQAAASARLHVKDSATPIIKVESTATGGTGASIRFDHTSPSPADTDDTAILYAYGSTDNGAGGVASTNVLWGSIAHQLVDSSDATKESKWYIQTNVSNNRDTRLTIQDDVTVNTGNLVIGTSGKGIDFSNQASPAAGMTDELLDRYELGTWTPLIADAASAGNTNSGGTLTGRYTRIGNKVTCWATLTNALTVGLTAGNDLYIQGLPFACNGTAPGIGAVECGGINFVDTPASLSIGVEVSTSACRIIETKDNVIRDFVIVSELTSGTNTIRFVLEYYV